MIRGGPQFSINAPLWSHDNKGLTSLFKSTVFQARHQAGVLESVSTGPHYMRKLAASYIAPRWLALLLLVGGSWWIGWAALPWMRLNVHILTMSLLWVIKWCFLLIHFSPLQILLVDTILCFYWVEFISSLLLVFVITYWFGSLIQWSSFYIGVFYFPYHTLITFIIPQIYLYNVGIIFTLIDPTWILSLKCFALDVLFTSLPSMITLYHFHGHWHCTGQFMLNILHWLWLKV